MPGPQRVFIIYLFLSIYNYTLTNAEMAPIAQWLERGAQEAGGPGFDPHLVEMSVLQVRPFKVSGGSPVPLRSKHRATGSRTWKEDLLGQQTK